MTHRQSGAILMVVFVALAAIVVFAPRTPRSGPEVITSPAVSSAGAQAQSGSPAERGSAVDNPTPATTRATPHPTAVIDDAGAAYFRPTPRPALADSLQGSATWYAYVPGGAAAGPGLRRWLGPNWRGTVVTVIAPGCTCKPVAVRLSDWCLCRDDRIIDLDVRSFAALGDPSRGIIPVLVLEGDWTK